MDFYEVLGLCRKAASESDKGSRFERLIKNYFMSDPMWSDSVKEAWIWNDFPYKHAWGGRDIGIDIVLRRRNGEWIAVQCKCYDENAYVTKEDLDTFLSASSKFFIDASGSRGFFSERIVVSTTNKWSFNAEEIIKNQTVPCLRITLADLKAASVDWSLLWFGNTGVAALKPKKTLLPHQVEALDAAHGHFKAYDRGKLIMACGTGKTFTSLKIAEKEANKGLVLFLVPSIALLRQTLREWKNEASSPFVAICVCSDSKVSSKKNDDDGAGGELAYPASTDVQVIADRIIEARAEGGMTVVFSTYQSVECVYAAIHKLREEGFKDASFDFVICDEAHRTTGYAVKAEDASAFAMVHSDNFPALKRMYMTATPRIYTEESKSKVKERKANDPYDESVLFSMDDESVYGKEFYRLGFSSAVEKNLLSDYRVLIINTDESLLTDKILSLNNSNISSETAAKLTGCINALEKKVIGDDGVLASIDPAVMTRAVAFCGTIKMSKEISGLLQDISATRFGGTKVLCNHVDGTMNALRRDELLSWLDSPSDGECRVLSNARCLSEGVDVPALDAAIFMTAKKSSVDIVQSVGRVMRRAPNKKYGYIIIPVFCPKNVTPEEAISSSDNYKQVWSVLSALRAHDDRLTNFVNILALEGKPKETGGNIGDKESELPSPIVIQGTMQFPAEDFQEAFYARLVEHVGEKRYWENWAKDVAEIAVKEIERISTLITQQSDIKNTFESFLEGLQAMLNPSVNAEQAIEMLAQHMITAPVFEALFEEGSFVASNAVSQAMQGMLDLIHQGADNEDMKKLQPFYESVKRRVKGIKTADGRQKIIVELYDKFFRTAFPKMTEKLGIVYTPVEIVDFIIASADDIMRTEFSKGLSDKDVRILDPFTGTGTFITRLLQSGRISMKDIIRKYSSELFANEIVLLAYYIAVVNIEMAFNSLVRLGYKPFTGICLCDTFSLGENEGEFEDISSYFRPNSDAILNEQSREINVILGNPPYSVGQKSANDNAQNEKYAKLEDRIRNTYVKYCAFTNKNGLYDSYIKAFRWASDRLGNEGIIGFVTNGAWLDNAAFDGFRYCLEKEFAAVYVLNLRGNCRVSGDLRRKEGGGVFGVGSRTPVAVCILVKKPHDGKAVIRYVDIGDYLSREQKLEKVKKAGSFLNMDSQVIVPNEHNDWISDRDEAFQTFIPLYPVKKFDDKAESFFTTYSRGYGTSNDALLYNYSMDKLDANINIAVDFYNSERLRFNLVGVKGTKAADFVIYDANKIKWTSALLKGVISNTIIRNSAFMRKGLYRPYCVLNIKNDLNLIYEKALIPKLYPDGDYENKVIVLPGTGGTNDFSCMITDKIPDLHLNDSGSQAFPLYWYEETAAGKATQARMDLWGEAAESRMIRHDAISNWILKQARHLYGSAVVKEDIFYYVYGFLHLRKYRERFSDDLKRSLPRIPLVADKQQFLQISAAGRHLAELHLNFEPESSLVAIDEKIYAFNYVTKMRLSKDKKTLFINDRIQRELPDRVHEYVINGRSAIEWLVDRYQIKTDKESGITNNPNDYAREHCNPEYIPQLVDNVIRLSMKTLEITDALNALDISELSTK